MTNHQPSDPPTAEAAIDYASKNRVFGGSVFMPLLARILWNV